MELKKDHVQETTTLYGTNNYFETDVNQNTIRLPFLFVENSKNFLCIIGQDQYFKKVSNSFCEASGYTKEELCSKPFTEFLVFKNFERASFFAVSGNVDYYFECSLAARKGKI